MKSREGLRAQCAPHWLCTVLLALPGFVVADTSHALPVTTAAALQAQRPAILAASGAIAAWEEVSISARTTGLPLVEVTVRVGDHVKKGQLLARFDEAPVLTEIAQARAAVLQAEASAKESAANSDRALALEGKGAMSKTEIQQLTTRASVAEGQLAQAKAARAAVELRLAYTRVIAPDSGVVSTRTAMLGEVPQLGSELFRMIAQDRLEWRAELTSPQLSQVKPGLPVNIELPDGHTLGGRVREISPTVDGATRLGLVYADLDRSDATRVNMYVKGKIELDPRRVVLVPAESIVTRDGRSYAATLDGSRAKLLPVTLGLRGPETIEVLTGLSPGATVLVRGAGFVSDGTQVQVARPELAP
jgi:HlyD family secretion protein